MFFRTWSNPSECRILQNNKKESTLTPSLSLNDIETLKQWEMHENSDEETFSTRKKKISTYLRSKLIASKNRIRCILSLLQSSRTNFHYSPYKK